MLAGELLKSHFAKFDLVAVLSKFLEQSHFDKEKFDALPEEMKARLDSQSLKELEKENPPFPTINNANTESTVLFTQVFTEQFCPNDTIIYNRYGFPLNPILLGSCLLAPTPVGARALYSTFSPV